MKVIGERSPGDKGTLDSYLKASLEDDKNTTNSVLKARQEAFTKKLDLERLPKPVSAGGEECLNKQSESQVLDKGVAMLHVLWVALCQPER